MTTSSTQTLRVAPSPEDAVFEGVGAVNGGGATSVLLKDYPAEQRDQILDLVFTPKLGASVSTMLVEVPGDGNATQGSMPSHQHTRDDLDGHRGYTWWIMREAKRRNPAITLDAAAWSAPGWIGDPEGEGLLGDGEFWSQDAADYYASWVRLLREEHGLELDALGGRNEKGVSLRFLPLLREALDHAGFPDVRIHGFDNWPTDKWDFVTELRRDPAATAAIDALGAHVLYDRPDDQTPPEVRAWAAEHGKAIWNTEDHVYKHGFDCLISIVECFNENYLLSGATKVVLWYDIAGVYPLEPYSNDPAMIVAHEPWSGHYRVRQALWGYAHYGQFTEVGWRYVDGGSSPLELGGTAVTLRSPDGADVSIVAETKGATGAQRLVVQVPTTAERTFCVWRSDAVEQFVRLGDVRPVDGVLELDLAPDSVYSISTTTGQRKGGFADVPASSSFPFPYRDTFDGYGEPTARGRLPRWTADIAGAFELAETPDGGIALRQMVPVPTVSWAPDWRPYTILGDRTWTDYRVAVRIRLADGESAGVMARVNDVGSGYGFEPKGYYVELDAAGGVRLVEINGKVDVTELVGDAEQQAAILARREADPGGERVLATAHCPHVAPEEWHELSLTVEGTTLTAAVDGVTVASATDARHAAGMAGLLVGAGDRLSQAWFDDVRVTAVDGEDPRPMREPGDPLYPERLG